LTRPRNAHLPADFASFCVKNLYAKAQLLPLRSMLRHSSSKNLALRAQSGGFFSRFAKKFSQIQQCRAMHTGSNFSRNTQAFLQKIAWSDTKSAQNPGIPDRVNRP
jgi:hypothetical protein